MATRTLVAFGSGEKVVLLVAVILGVALFLVIGGVLLVLVIAVVAGLRRQGRSDPPDD